MANRTQLQQSLHKPYDRILFAKEVLNPVFGSGFSLNSSLVPASIQPNKTEHSVIDKVSIYGNITLDDSTEITCYEIVLQPTVRIEQSKVAIQRYVRKLLTAGQAALVNFVAPQNKNVWRLTLVAKDSELTTEGIKEKTTHAKRYTYLLGPNETCKTAAERFETLSIASQINFEALINAFSVEKLSKAFFDEYTLHYENFINHLNKPGFKKSVFKGDDKAIRDFTKKLLGRVVFLYFVQKKGWMGASSKEYKDGDPNFMKNLFLKSGGDENYYPNWLTGLFFETLNKERANDDFLMPDGKKKKVPFLNGGLFDKESHDEHILTFEPKLFHNPDNEDAILIKSNSSNARGFLDFLNAFNFTVHEDSPDEHTVAVDPEMLGHIFENLLEDNKDKGAFYTPKEIVHYMCQESLTEYLSTHLSKEYTVYKQIDKEQIEIFGNETRHGQLKMIEALGDKALNRDDVGYIVKHKDISQLTKQQLKRIDQLLDTVKICDPAIGSGAFPMGLLQEIFAIKEIIAFELKSEWKPAAVKENIVQNSIYGVDIEKGAVDIARLRFWLSLVVDEEEPRALPNLDYKIVVGNSLVSKLKIDGHEEIVEIDWKKVQHTSKTKVFVENIQHFLKEIASKQRNFFKPETKNKKKLHADIRNLKLDLLINQLSLNKEVYLSNNVEKGGFAPTASDVKYNAGIKLTKKHFENLIAKLHNIKSKKDEPFEHFDWKLDFPEILNSNLLSDEKHKGFDIIIANPPYVGEKGHKDKFQEIKLGYLKEYYNSKMDIFYFFFHLSIDFIKPEGVVNFITTNYFPTADGAIKLRSYIEKETQILSIINFNEFRIFDSALGQHNMITLLKKTKQEYTSKIVNVNRKNETGGRILENILDGIDPNTTYQLVNKQGVFDGPKSYIRIGQGLSSHFDSIFQAIKLNYVLLSDVTEINSGCDITISRITSKHIEEFPNKGYIKNSGVFVLSESEAIELKRHLNPYEKNLIKPYIKSSNIDKFVHSFSKEFLIYTEWDTPVVKIPNLINHLKKYKPIMDDQIARYDEPNWPWYSLHRPREKSIFENPSKIVVPYRANKNLFALSPSPTYSSRDVFYISPIKKNGYTAEELGCILNSKLIYFWLYNRGKRKGETLELYYTPLSEIPIPNKAFSKEFMFFTSSVVFLKNQISSNITDQLIPIYFEQIIDGMVYELYFSELLKKYNRDIVNYLGALPKMDDELSDDKKMSIIKEVFNRLNERDHPVRVNLFYMNSIPEIAIIEGRHENN